MGVDAVGHAADDGILVGLLGQQGQQLADADAVHVGGDRLVQRAAVVVAGLRLGVEGVEVRRAAPHPDLDDRLGLGLGGWRRCAARARPAPRPPSSSRPRPPGRADAPRAGKSAMPIVAHHVDRVWSRCGIQSVIHDLPDFNADKETPRC